VRSACVIAAIAACNHPQQPPDNGVTCGPGTMLVGAQCVAPNTPCGLGTHDDNGTCVANAPSTVYQIQVAPQIAADGTTAVDVFAYGVQLDGSPATDLVVLNTDRPGAGVYGRPQVTLATMGAHTTFVPCAKSVPGCTGPLKLTLALASAPNVIVATTSTALVDPVTIDPARACLTGGNVLSVQGNDVILDGSVTITSGRFTGGWANSFATNDTFQVDVSPTDPMQGGPWRLVFSSETFNTSLSATHYPNVQRWFPTFSQMQLLQGALLVSNNGVGCDTITGDFTVETPPGNAQSPFTASFTQHCFGSTTTVLRGCVHWSP
jgi:hypothetical protein